MHIPLREDVDWVGHLDWQVRDFHGYEAVRGTTYNAYLIRDERTALIDTVKGPYAAELLRKVARLTDPTGVDYIVCNHAEPDHSGALPEVIRAMPQATVLCDKRCRDALARHYDTGGWRFELVGSGDEISLGRRTLRFVETPMVHWPESMFTYVPEEKILFSMDAFGQHYCTSQRFDDQVPLPGLMSEAKAYYANIIMPFGKQVAQTLKKAAELEMEMIAPAHGVIWRSRGEEILGAYADWAAGRVSRKVVVVYDTMWESTAQMAEAIVEGAACAGAEALAMHVRRTSMTRIATEVLDAGAVAVGSSTLNRHVMPAAAAVLTYLEGLRPVGRAGLAFGSYGWGTGGPERVHEWLGRMNWELPEKPLKVQYRPTPETLDTCRRAGARLAHLAAERADR
ncbi:MAG: FprA family A-type flavoprotein [Pirellulales bacterium]